MKEWCWMVLALVFMVTGCGDTLKIKTSVSSAAKVTAEECQCDCEIERRVGTPMED